MSHKRRCLHSTSTNLRRKGTYSLDTSLDSPLCCRLERLSSLISLDYFRGKLKCQMILGWPALSWSCGAWVLAAVRNFGKSSSESPGIFLYKVGRTIMRYCWTQEGCAVGRLQRTHVSVFYTLAPRHCPSVLTLPHPPTTLLAHLLLGRWRGNPVVSAAAFPLAPLLAIQASLSLLCGQWLTWGLCVFLAATCCLIAVFLGIPKNAGVWGFPLVLFEHSQRLIGLPRWH